MVSSMMIASEDADEVGSVWALAKAAVLGGGAKRPPISLAITCVACLWLKANSSSNLVGLGLIEAVRGGPGGVRRPWSLEGETVEAEAAGVKEVIGTSSSNLAWRFTDGLSLQGLLEEAVEAASSNEVVEVATAKKNIMGIRPSSVFCVSSL